MKKMVNLSKGYTEKLYVLLLLYFVSSKLFWNKIKKNNNHILGVTKPKIFQQLWGSLKESQFMKKTIKTKTLKKKLM